MKLKMNMHLFMFLFVKQNSNSIYVNLQCYKKILKQNKLCFTVSHCVILQLADLATKRK